MTLGEASMILEERDYLLHPGKVPEYLKRYQEAGLAIQQPVLGNLVGYFFTEIGELNRVVHMWGYDSLAERERRRAELAKSEAWKSYLATVMPLIIEMKTRILTPAPFSPIR
jgi:hypothetical protein